jgi:acyl-CoA thioester hydrolase
VNDPEVPPSEQLPFKVRIHTRWSDEDNHGVLNNAVYLTLLEEARYAYFSSLGLLEDNRFPFVLAQAHVRFVAPGRGGCDVEVELGTLRIGTTSFEQAYRVREADSGAVWCEARALLVVFDPATGRKRAMSDAFRERIRGGGLPGSGRSEVYQPPA